MVVFRFAADGRILFVMSDIYICREHNTTIDKARDAATEVARDIAERYDVDYHWHDNELHFTRTGVDGTICIDEAQIEVSAKLGFMLKMLKGPIEQVVQNQLDELFS